MKKEILVLNKHWFPVGTADTKATFGNIFSGVVHPIDVVYEEDENGDPTDKISYMSAVKNLDEWLSLPVRNNDSFIKTVRGNVRIPKVVTCANYSEIHYKEVYFPTKQNVLKRDKNICGYTGIALNKVTMSIDHIFPKSRCSYNPNTWENQVACHRELNTFKGDRLPEEVDLTGFNPKDPELADWVASNSKRLKLLKYPTKPKSGYVFTEFSEEWANFVGG